MVKDAESAGMTDRASALRRKLESMLEENTTATESVSAISPMNGLSFGTLS